MPTVKVDAEKCIGCGLCVSMCEEAFELKNDGKAHVKSTAGCSSCDCKSVAESCPVDAITYKE
jgi:ferredoxin